MTTRHSKSHAIGSAGKGKHSPVRRGITTAREKAAYQRTASLVSDLRRGEGPYTELLRKYHLDSRTARRHAGRNLLGRGRGQPVRASKSDRMVRELLFPTSFGDVPRLTRSSRDATKIASFFQDRDKLLRGKLSTRDFEARWRGVVIAGQEVFADASAILGMADADIFKMEELYASTGGPL